MQQNKILNNTAQIAFKIIEMKFQNLLFKDLIHL